MKKFDVIITRDRQAEDFVLKLAKDGYITRAVIESEMRIFWNSENPISAEILCLAVEMGVAIYVILPCESPVNIGEKAFDFQKSQFKLLSSLNRVKHNFHGKLPWEVVPYGLTPIPRWVFPPERDDIITLIELGIDVTKIFPFFFKP